MKLNYKVPNVAAKHVVNTKVKGKKVSLYYGIF